MIEKGPVDFDSIVESSDESVVPSPNLQQVASPCCLRVGFGESVGISRWQKQVSTSKGTGVAYGYKDLRTRGPEPCFDIADMGTASSRCPLAPPATYQREVQ